MVPLSIEFDSSDYNLMTILANSNLVVLLIVYLSFFLDNVLLTVIVPIVPDYLFHNDLNMTLKYEISSLSPLQRKFKDLENDNGLLGALLASKAFVQLVCTPFVGYITFHIGYYLPLLCGSINMLVATLIFAFGRNYWCLVFARALHGSSSAAVSVCGMCLLAESLPKNIRSRLMPLAFGGIALGVLIGYPLGGVAYQLIGKAAPFLIIALLIIVNIFLQFRYLPIITPLRMARQEASTYSHASWKALISNKYTMLTTGAICICTATMSILEPCIPMWLMAIIEPPPSKWQLGAVFIPDSLGYFLGSQFAGFLPILPWRIGIIALLLTGLSACAIPLSAHLSDLVMPHFGLGLGVGTLDAVLVPLLATLVDATQNYGCGHYGPVYALQQVAVCLAYSIGPLFGGIAVHRIGFPWLIRLVGLLNIMYCPLLVELDSELYNRQRTHFEGTLDDSNVSTSATNRKSNGDVEN